jgi:hypothetical protein
VRAGAVLRGRCVPPYSAALAAYLARHGLRSDVALKLRDPYIASAPQPRQPRTLWVCPHLNSQWPLQ